MAKPPKLDHVKWVRRGAKLYAYFNTGLKTDQGQPVRVPLPDFANPAFFPRYGALKGGRTKRARLEAAPYTVTDMIREYEGSSDYATKAPNTQRLYTQMLGKVRDEWGKFPADKLTPQIVQIALDQIPGAGTHNMVIAALGVLYRWGRKRGKTSAEPTKDLEIRAVGKHNAWPEDILELALQSSDDTIRLAVHLMAFTGLRIGDALSLRWGDIRGDEIHVTPQKTKRFGKRLHIPILSELKAELDRAPRLGLTVLHGISEGPLRRKLQAFTLSHGVKTVPHGLRVNAVEALLYAGCSVAETSAITGQTYKIVEKYAAKINTRKLGKAAVLKWEDRRRKKV